MKCLIYSDVHWSVTSSIVNGRGKNYSIRLEHLIDGMNWINELAKSKDCEITICAGDFFHRPNINDEELTALREINWDNDITHYFICGNHESSVVGLNYNTVVALSDKNRKIIYRPTSISFDNAQFHFIPYIVESDRKSLDNYIENKDASKKQIIISHNDISGIQYGGFESVDGFSIKEINDSCDLFLNGHLHNSEWISNKILNVGSFSGHNFTNDSSKYVYGAWILDTNDLSMTQVENPFGFNFYKYSIMKESDLELLSRCKSNSIISVSCEENLLEKCKESISLNNNILNNRITVLKSCIASADESSTSSVDSILRDGNYIKKFKQFCLENINNTDVLLSELSYLCQE